MLDRSTEEMIMSLRSIMRQIWMNDTDNQLEISLPDVNISYFKIGYRFRSDLGGKKIGSRQRREL